MKGQVVRRARLTPIHAVFGVGLLDTVIAMQQSDTLAIT